VLVIAIVTIVLPFQIFPKAHFVVNNSNVVTEIHGMGIQLNSLLCLIGLVASSVKSC